jgi:AraC-like DNA-binding protein
MALEVFSDMSERLNYNLPGFPLYVRKGELRQFDRYAAACHWHPDIEFIFVLDGNMDYFVNNQILHICAGEGIFINSKRLHYGYSKDKTDCTFLCIVVHPSLLGEETHTGKEYIESKFGSSTEDFILLTEKSGWHKEALETISRIYGEMYGGTQNPMRLISQITSLCACIGDNVKSASMNQADERSWLAVWNMTGFIQKNYSQKITIDDIAAAGFVCRSKCCKLFNEYIGQTPNIYLTRYRIQKSCEMLIETNMSVIEISLTCGFQSPSYFTHIFQKETGLTPREYRRQSKSMKKLSGNCAPYAK